MMVNGESVWRHDYSIQRYFSITDAILDTIVDAIVDITVSIDGDRYETLYRRMESFVEPYEEDCSQYGVCNTA